MSLCFLFHCVISDLFCELLCFICHCVCLIIVLHCRSTVVPQGTSKACFKTTYRNKKTLKLKHFHNMRNINFRWQPQPHGSVKIAYYCNGTNTSVTAHQLVQAVQLYWKNMSLLCFHNVSLIDDFSALRTPQKQKCIQWLHFISNQSTEQKLLTCSIRITYVS